MKQDLIDETGDRSPRTYRVEALAKGLRILSLFTNEQPALRVKDIVALTGIPMPTAFRLVATLESEGYLERTIDGGVRPGTRVLALGFAALQGLDVVETSTGVVRDLAELTGQTVTMGVLHGDQVLFVSRAQPHRRRGGLLAGNLRIGAMVPAVYSSMGKVLLAHEAETELAMRITKKSFEGEWGPGAVRTMAGLRRQLAEVRAEGCCVQHEEVLPGISSIAAPITQVGQGVVAALNVVVAAALFNRERMLAELKGPLLEACAEISQRLGG